MIVRATMTGCYCQKLEMVEDFEVPIVPLLR
jgi:hypothetical protein